MVATVTRSTPIERFCRELVKQERTPELMSPERLAQRFCDYFSLDSPIGKLKAIALCQQTICARPLQRPLPPGVKGIHAGTGRTFCLYYAKDKGQGVVSQTILHEIYEIVMEFLNGFLWRSTFSEVEREALADRFAAAVLMPYEDFVGRCALTACNPLRLRWLYRVPFPLLLTRMKHVVAVWTDFVGIVYANRAAECLITDRAARCRLETDFGELNEPCNFEVEHAVFGLQHKRYRTKDGAPYVLPRRGASLSERGWDHDLARHSLEQKRPIAQIRANDMMFASFPAISSIGLVSNVIVTGMHEVRIGSFLERLVISTEDLDA